MSRKKTNQAVFFLPVLLLILSQTAGVLGQTSVPEMEPDDDSFEAKMRVARISYLKGRAQIRRAGSRRWERAGKNLPVVEGDELAVGRETRLEIQFDTDKFLRLEEKSFLKVLTLRPEGVAVSLPTGSLSLRIREFDKRNEYFEIDAPRTTIAVEQAGMYRVNAGDNNYTVVEINVTEGGRAQIYSADAVFPLRDGRRARVFTEEPYAGEWDLDDALRYTDSFDVWSLERDELIARRLADSYYDRYYDRGIYGAEDLSGHGEWIQTVEYGHVWRPFSQAISPYADWSPYRYGEWRWIPAFGWTWFNYEPWGWATYHYGRWLFFNGSWVWTPYPKHHRTRRSWWRPALVIIAAIGRSIYWCPLPYEDEYRPFYRRRNRRGQDPPPQPAENRNRIGPNPRPTRTPGRRAGRLMVRPNDGTGRAFGRIPASGVITVDRSEFGSGQSVFRTASKEAARRVLTKPRKDSEIGPDLPDYAKLQNDTANSKIFVSNPPAGAKSAGSAQTGAGLRRRHGPIGEKLRKKLIDGNRRPAVGRGAAPPAASGKQHDRRKTDTIRRRPSPTNVIAPQKRRDASGIRHRKNAAGSKRPAPVYVPPPVSREKKTDRPTDRGAPGKTAPRIGRKPEKRPPAGEGKPKPKPAPPARQKPKKEDPAPAKRPPLVKKGRPLL